ncbi:MAG: Hvo_1808 family surface protein, partial [Halobaculum sp.]
WEAQFVLGENESVESSLESLYGSGIVGFYAPRDDRIVIVSDSETPRIDRATLAHELVHALQDVHFDRARRTTRDGRTAQTGLREGDANLVAALYERRCRSEWSCLPRPNATAAVDRDAGLYVDVIAPYTDGPAFVDRLRDRGGWAAVNDAYDDPPVSSEQLIHPDAYPDDRPARVRVPDRSSDAWRRVGTERLGELGAFLTLWSAGGIDRTGYFRGDGEFSARNYSHPASAGWAGDRLAVYRNGDRAGYVWRLRWETARDAERFAAAYRRGLRALGAERVAPGVYRIAEGGFADAFRVVVRNRTVTVTNAPTTDALNAVHDDG